MHLRNEQFPQEVIKQFTHDIFGWRESNGVYHEGLVDCNDIPCFDQQLSNLKKRWDDREMSAFSDRKAHVSNFHSWFLKYKAVDFRHCTLREDIGLGSPPVAFYTNDSESVNALLKGTKNSSGQYLMKKSRRLLSSSSVRWRKLLLGVGSINYGLIIPF